MDIIKEPAIRVTHLFASLHQYGFTSVIEAKDVAKFVDAHLDICFKLDYGGWIIYLNPLIEGLMTGDIELEPHGYRRLPHVALAKDLRQRLTEATSGP